MTETTVPQWVEAALPPLNPPVDGGLAVEDAEAALSEWSLDLYMGLAVCWEQYAAMVAGADPAAVSGAVSSVQTGSQSVNYSPAVPTGPAGAALARAAFYRTRASVRSVPSGPFLGGWYDPLGSDPEYPVPHELMTAQWNAQLNRARMPYRGDLRLPMTRAGYSDVEKSATAGYPVLTDEYPAVQTGVGQQPPLWAPEDEPVGRALGMVLSNERDDAEGGAS